MVDIKLENIELNQFQNKALQAVINKLNEMSIYKKFSYQYKQDKKKNLIIVFSPIKDELFYIDFFISEDDIIIKLDEWGDMTCDLSEKSDEEKIENILLFLEKLNNHTIKLVKYYSNKSPYKWECFENINNHWKSLGRLNDVFYNYFGKKTRKEFFI